MRRGSGDETGFSEIKWTIECRKHKVDEHARDMINLSCYSKKGVICNDEEEHKILYVIGDIRRYDRNQRMRQ